MVNTAKLKKAAPKRPNSKFTLIKAIRGEKVYKDNVVRRDKVVRDYVDDNYTQYNSGAATPGKLIMFNYFQPQTREQLQYYDAMPCTIFFGIVNTDNGPRVIGFNIHYYPPRIRYKLMDKIFSIFKNIYLKSWDKPLKNELSNFNYKFLIQQLQKEKLDFGVREYIPSLMAKVVPIPPSGWSKAVFTEGRFRKETRQQILSYWKDKTQAITRKPPKPKAKPKTKTP